MGAGCKGESVLLSVSRLLALVAAVFHSSSHGGAPDGALLRSGQLTVPLSKSVCGVRCACRPRQPLRCCFTLQALALVGEFNNWDPKPEHWGVKNDYGVFQLFLPDSEDGASAIPHRQAPDGVGAAVAVQQQRSAPTLQCWKGRAAPHGSIPATNEPRVCFLTHCRTKIKTRLETAYGELVERIPAWIKWATQVSLDSSRYSDLEIVRGWFKRLTQVSSDSSRYSELEIVRGWFKGATQVSSDSSRYSDLEIVRGWFKRLTQVSSDSSRYSELEIVRGWFKGATQVSSDSSRYSELEIVRGWFKGATQVSLDSSRYSDLEIVRGLRQPVAC